MASSLYQPCRIALICIYAAIPGCGPGPARETLCLNETCTGSAQRLIYYLDENPDLDDNCPAEITATAVLPASELPAAASKKLNYLGQELKIYVEPGKPTQIEFPGDIKYGFKRKKPVIYLYPKTEIDVQVKLELEGTLTASYPPYDHKRQGWTVRAYPDGTVRPQNSNRSYAYLFWEADIDAVPDYSPGRGFLVPGAQVEEFLESKLTLLGLSPKERDDFIVYWLPRMNRNPYNHVYFAGAEYEASARLTVEPRPDSQIRVFMVTRPLEKKIELTPQALTPRERTGFAVVEWGGMELPAQGMGSPHAE